MFGSSFTGCYWKLFQLTTVTFFNCTKLSSLWKHVCHFYKGINVRNSLLTSKDTILWEAKATEGAKIIAGQGFTNYAHTV